MSTKNQSSVAHKSPACEEVFGCHFEVIVAKLVDNRQSRKPERCAWFVCAEAMASTRVTRGVMSIFSTYSQGENRVTASVIAVLQSLSLSRME
jgi:hypothetical protein